MDRYNHDLGDDTDDTDDSPLFGSFSSYSPQSRKISQTRPHKILQFETETDSLKKQLFKNELERTIAQLTLNSPVSAVQSPSKTEETLTEKLVDEKPSIMMNDDQNKNASPPNRSTDSHFIVKKMTPPLPSTLCRSNNLSGPCYSTPESSQTESDDISPQIQRKRHNHNRDKLPRFSISFDDESNIT